MASPEVSPAVEAVAVQIEPRWVKAERKEAFRNVRQEKQRRPANSSQKEWADTFELVTSYYERTRCGSVHRQLDKGDRIPVTNIDYACDVDIAARNVLSPAEYRIFLDVFSECTVPEDAVPVAIMAHIKSRCGRIWKQRRLHCLFSYFHEDTLRKGKHD